MTDSRDLVEVLEAAGAYPAALGDLFRMVPRSLFLPDRVWVRADGNAVPVDRKTDLDAWVNAAYADQPIITQYDDGATAWPKVGDIPTASSSQPSVVAAMLAILNPQPGERVLEIGTGTGWNAACLATLVGPNGLVHTIEVDPEIYAHAKLELGPQCANVHVALRDGTYGLPGSTPFDRIISTVGVYVNRVPYAWVEQCRRGGVILTPLRADLASGPLVLFTVDRRGVARGRIQPTSVGFMVSRAWRGLDVDDDDPRWSTRAEVESTSAVHPKEIFEDPAAKWAVAMAVPQCLYDDDPWWWRDPLTGSWATFDDGIVRQAGPRQLWLEIAGAYRWWQDQGRPSLDAWEFVITRKTQAVRLRTDVS